MQAIKRSETKPEVALRSQLHAAGLRFRKDFVVIADGRRVRPDVVFTKRKVAVFVDGCFWHVCPEHGRQPSSNEWYWTPKLRRNIERDTMTNDALRSAGWRVVRVWEHEETADAALRVIQAIEHAFE